MEHINIHSTYIISNCGTNLEKKQTFSIQHFIKDKHHYLFSHFTYTGLDVGNKTLV